MRNKSNKQMISKGELQDMSNPKHRSEKAYKEFKRVPDYFTGAKCAYRLNVKCGYECIFYEYCSKRRK